MAEGIYTEREWRRRGACLRGEAPVCWGAQYVQHAKPHTLHRNKRLHVAMLLGAVLTALLMPLCRCKQLKPAAYPMAVAPAAAAQLSVRDVSGIAYAMPPGLALVQTTYTREQLCRGKLMLLDGEHPLPKEAPRAITVPIVTYGKGMVPVNDLSLKTGKETIRALTGLFADLRNCGIGGFAVWGGAQTPVEHREQLMADMRRLAAGMPLEQAVLAAASTVETGAPEEMQQPYTVELRASQPGSSLPDERPLEATVMGRQLLQCAWRNGFVRTRPNAGKGAAFRFRYVGLAHATAMTYLDVDLPAYLAILHEKKVMTVRGEGGQTFVIQCVPVQGERTVFQLPKGAVSEVSLDNTGYAVAASLLSGNWEQEAEPVNKVLAAQ